MTEAKPCARMTPQELSRRHLGVITSAQAACADATRRVAVALPSEQEDEAPLIRGDMQQFASDLEKCAGRLRSWIARSEADAETETT